MFQSVAQPPGLAADATDDMADVQHAHESVQGAAEPVQDALRQAPQHSGAQQGRHDDLMSRDIAEMRTNGKFKEVWDFVMWLHWEIGCLQDENKSLREKLATSDRKMKETETRNVAMNEEAGSLREQVDHLKQVQTHYTMATMAASRFHILDLRLTKVEAALTRMLAALSGEGAGVHPGRRDVGGRGGRGRGGRGRGGTR